MWVWVNVVGKKKYRKNDKVIEKKKLTEKKVV